MYRKTFNIVLTDLRYTILRSSFFIVMRRKQKLKTFDRPKLQNLEHSQYASYVLTQFKPRKMDKIDEVLPPLATAITNEDEVLNLSAGAE